MVLAACVPTVQRAGSPMDGFTGPRFEPVAERFISFDGAELGLTAWLPPNNQEPHALIIGLHGMNDYANTFYLAGPWFAERGVAVFAYDARGFGRSPNRGVWAGERLMMEDLRTAVRVARSTYPNAEIVVVGDSMGSAEAIATFGAPGAPTVDRLVLVAPAVWGWLAPPQPALRRTTAIAMAMPTMDLFFIGLPFVIVVVLPVIGRRDGRAQESCAWPAPRGRMLPGSGMRRPRTRWPGLQPRRWVCR